MIGRSPGGRVVVALAGDRGPIGVEPDQRRRPHLLGAGQAVHERILGEQQGWPHLVLPAVTLAAYPTALVARLTRSSMLEILTQDYVRIYQQLLEPRTQRTAA